MKKQLYYHAGALREANPEMQAETKVYWSDKTRRTSEAASAEARKLARKYGGKPIVEYWDRAHGLRPGWDCAAGSFDVAEGNL
jgi:hypothetical protein